MMSNFNIQIQDALCSLGPRSWCRVSGCRNVIKLCSSTMVITSSVQDRDWSAGIRRLKNAGLQYLLQNNKLNYFQCVSYNAKRYHPKSTGLTQQKTKDLVQEKTALGEACLTSTDCRASCKEKKWGTVFMPFRIRML